YTVHSNEEAESGDLGVDSPISGVEVAEVVKKLLGDRTPGVDEIPYARTGMWRARYENSVLEAEAKGPNASAEFSASLKGVKVMAGAEIASASASAGPLKAKIGLGVDTGFKIGPDGVGVKVLGTGFNVGSQTSVSLLGSEVRCSFM
uniref:Uncharacterized protein n=1 Tax=Paramormyrops kingsleyae TaxID=1676925 RepID=A0A3B3RVT0_9TELE